MKGLEDKHVKCTGCDKKYTVLFKKSEQEKQSECPHCGKLNIHSRPKKGESKRKYNSIKRI
jgi:hypothetical protein